MKEWMKWVKTLIEILLIAAVIYGAICLTSSLGMSEEEYTTAWIVCQPGDYVNARSRPSSRSSSVGWFDGGDEILLNGKEKNGYVCVVGRFEIGEAWVSKGYVVYEEPVRMSATATVISRGKLKARRCVDGKRRCWLRNGDEVKIYWWTEDWCVTNRGYVQTKYLEMDGI